MSLRNRRITAVCAAVVFWFALTAHGAETGKTVTTVSVTYSVNGGSPSQKKLTIEKGSCLTETPSLTRNGYTFAGWFTDSRYKKPFNIDDEIDSNIRLYAKWIKNPVVTFSAGGGKPAPPKQSVLPGDRVSVPEAPSRVGYTFGGWYADSKRKYEFDFDTQILTNTTIYAKWDKIPVVTFLSGGGKPAPSKMVVTPGSTIPAPPAMTKTGYTFDGWYTSSKHTTKYDFSDPIYTKTSLYAKWVRNPVVKFSTKGRCPTPEKQTLAPNGKASMPVLEIPDGFILEGWYRDSTCRKEFDFSAPVTSNVTVYANVIRDPAIPLIAVRK